MSGRRPATRSPSGTCSPWPSWLQLDDGSLEHAAAVDAAWVDRERPAHLLDGATLVYVAVYGEQRLMFHDRVAYCERADRLHDRAAVHRAQVLVKRRRLVKT